MAYQQTQSFDMSTQDLHNPHQYSDGPSRVRGGDGANQYGYSPKKRRSKWLTIGLPVALLVIIGAVLGGVLGSRAANNDDNNTTTAGAGSAAQSGVTAKGGAAAQTKTDAGSAAASSAAAKGELARLATATDSYFLPVYPTGTATSGYVMPTTSARPNHTWPDDNASPSMSSPRSHPRLIAPSYKWEALSSNLISSDPYLAGWNATIMANATENYNAKSITYDVDGGLSGSGVLDVARELKVRVKNWGYAWRMTKDTKWVDRCFTELNVAMGNDASIPFGDGDTRWNPAHFLDVAEFSSAFGIAYDWFFDGFSDEQKTTIRNALVTNGLQYCKGALEGASSASTFSWWTAVDGNWNCVCNAGCTLGALAIVDEDTTGTASAILAASPKNAGANCAQAVRADGTWSETPNYWYFGTTGWAEMTSSLITATGSDQGMLTANQNFNLTGEYHMYVQGMTSLFDYADHGPNKYSATANVLLFMGSENGYNTARYSAYQRDAHDAAEPFSMFWYNPATVGAFWDGLPFDHHFDAPADDWAAMRSTWTDNNGLYVAMKAGNMTGHQTHGDIDAGDFVLDAMGQRWAGELGSGNYLSDGYFSSEAENSERWLYYRKRTEGQNTIVLNRLNQAVDAQPPTKFGSSGDAQGPSTSVTLADDSTAFYTMDLTSSYNGTEILRGVRTLNQRKQVLIQSDITAPDASSIQWRMHTNATISIDTAGTTATLTLGGETLDVKIINPTDQNLKFEQVDPVRYDSDPPLPTQPAGEVADQDNQNTKVLVINMNGGTYSLQVLFNPKWSGSSDSDFINPKSVPINDWSLTSHNA